MLNGPIIIVEDDQDDRDLLLEIFMQLEVKNELKFFDDGQDALDFLMVVLEQPFIILCDVNLPKMLGTELRQRINENEYLRSKSIPFIFLTTSADPVSLKIAYDQMVQGYFVKENRFEKVKEMINAIISYWKICKHPNNV